MNCLSLQAHTPKRSHPLFGGWATWALVLTTLFAYSAVWAKGSIQSTEAYLQQAFPEGVPAPKVLWLKGDLKQAVAEILQHPYPKLRIKYWDSGSKRVWILDEIGKEKPITTAVTIKDSKVQQVTVLAFRESRGWEVQQPFFTRQFQQAALNEKRQLDRSIDGITGATLSVRALRKQARLALFLDQKVSAGAR
ncbi:MAG: FMN-binding protein [bacterium]